MKKLCVVIIYLSILVQPLLVCSSADENKELPSDANGKQHKRSLSEAQLSSLAKLIGPDKSRRNARGRDRCSHDWFEEAECNKILKELQSLVAAK